MAQRRMFSLQIVDTDAFLDMPPTSQLLYFHLVMRSDDEGFVGNPKKIIRLVGSQDDDLKILTAKRFILTFQSGIIVIKHWLIHNTIRMDRFKKTAYADEKKGLIVKENGAYTELGNQMATKRKPNGNRLAPQVNIKLSKVKLRKVNSCAGETPDATTPASRETPSSKDGIAHLPEEPPVTEIFSFPDYLEIMKNDKKRQIQIIRLFWIEKKVVYERFQIDPEIGRSVKAAMKLIGYTDEQIISTMKFCSSRFNDGEFRWTLETVVKYIAEQKNASEGEGKIFYR